MYLKKGFGMWLTHKKIWLSLLVKELLEIFYFNRALWRTREKNAHTLTHTRSRVHTSTNVHPRAHLPRAHACTLTKANACAQTHAAAQTHAHVYKAHAQVRICTYTVTNARIHAQTHTFVYEQICARTHTLWYDIC